MEYEDMIEFEIRDKLSLEGYIYLINEYIELSIKEEMLKDEKNEKFFQLKRIKTAMDVLIENGIKIPEELSSMYFNLCDELSFSEDYISLIRDIGKIIPINNLRYLIWDISMKTKLSLEEISILIGCLPDTLDNLAHVTYRISKEDFQKFTNYYGIKHFGYWNKHPIRYIY